MAYPQFQAQYQQAQNIMLVPVQGEAGAQMYPVAAGSTVFLADFETGFCWLKSTAINGLPQPMRKFQLKEVTQPPKEAVTRAEFEELKQMIEKLAGGNANEQTSNAAVPGIREAVQAN